MSPKAAAVGLFGMLVACGWCVVPQWPGRCLWLLACADTGLITQEANAETNVLWVVWAVSDSGTQLPTSAGNQMVLVCIAWVLSAYR